MCHDKELHAMPWQQVMADAIVILEEHGELHLVTDGDSSRICRAARGQIFSLAVANRTTSAIILAAVANHSVEDAPPDPDRDRKMAIAQLIHVETDLDRWTNARLLDADQLISEMETLLAEIEKVLDVTGRK